jgi:hypothetical protein
MAASATYTGLGLESSSEGSPYTTSSDDLFADINWPEDEADTPSDEGLYLSSGSTGPENASPKVSWNFTIHVVSHSDLVRMLYMSPVSLPLRSRVLIFNVGMSLFSRQVQQMLSQSLTEGVVSPKRLEAS